MKIIKDQWPTTVREIDSIAPGEAFIWGDSIYVQLSDEPNSIGEMSCLRFDTVNKTGKIVFLHHGLEIRAVEITKLHYLLEE